MQRTRCAYFYDTATPCNKREPGSGCSAVGGINRMHAILGASEACIAAHPSDMCVALAALEARVQVQGAAGERTIAFADFHRLPGDTPQRDTNLSPDEIITAVELPARGFAANYTYLKIRDRLSYAFALVAVAVGLEMDGDTIGEARIALGSVAHKPWREPAAEAALRGQKPNEANFRRAADLLLRDAKGYEHNAFKIELARRTIVRALTQAARGTPAVAGDQEDRVRRACRAMSAVGRSWAARSLSGRSDPAPVQVAPHPRFNKAIQRANPSCHTSASLPPVSTAARRSPAPRNTPPRSVCPASPMASSSNRPSPRAASRASTRARRCASPA
jgi:hypothetical protein